MLYPSLQISNIYDLRMNSKERKLKEVFACDFFSPNDFTVPVGIPIFVFNHKISAMMLLTGNFLNAVDRDGLHGGPSDSASLCACDKTRLESFGSSSSPILHPNNSHNNNGHLVDTHILARLDSPVSQKPCCIYYTLRNIWAHACVVES